MSEWTTWKRSRSSIVGGCCEGRLITGLILLLLLLLLVVVVVVMVMMAIMRVI